MEKEKRGNRGVAAVEFALLLPLLVLLVMGIIEFSLILYDKAMITNASREGARYGILYTGEGKPRRSPQEITQVVSDYCLNKLVSLGGGGAQPTVNVIFQSQNTGDPLTVRVSYTYTFLLLPKFMENFLGTIVLTGETIMRYE